MSALMGQEHATEKEVHFLSPFSGTCLKPSLTGMSGYLTPVDSVTDLPYSLVGKST